MEKFFEYWKKGWKVYLMMICIHFSYLLLFLPVAMIVGSLGKRVEIYYFCATIVGLIFAPAVTYFVFKLFYKEQ